MSGIGTSENITVGLLEKYDIRFDNNSRAHPSFIRALKARVNEVTEYEQQISYLKKMNPTVYDFQFLQIRYL